MAHRFRTVNRNSAANLARQREYNSTTYKTQRQAAKHQVDAGHANCWRCGKPIDRHSPWHLGHDDNNRTIIRGPEHPACNLKAAARKGNRIANGRRQQVRTRRAQSRVW